MKRGMKQLLGLASGVLALAVVGDLIAGQIRPPMPSQSRPTNQPELPEAAKRPGKTAVFPIGEEWKAYLAQKPLDVGGRVPPLVLTNHRGEVIRPPSQSQPTILGVMCGCPECAIGGMALVSLRKRAKSTYTSVLIVSNSSKYVWDQMVGSFGKTNDLVHDPDGSLFKRLRAPGKERRPEPIIWGIGPNGAIRYHRRPHRYDQTWIQDLCNALKIKAEKVSDSGFAIK